MNSDIENFEHYDEMIEFLSNKYINSFVNSLVEEKHPITDWVSEHINLPKIGSHLISPRMNGAYTHHGIYVGDKEVIHYAGLSEGLNTAPVEKTSLSKFLDGNKYTIREHPYTKFSAGEIIKRAYSRLEEDNYNVIFNNCEHFVNWCIYDISRSEQISQRVSMLSPSPVKSSIAILNISKSITSFLNGTISKEKLFDDIKRETIPMSTATVYATVGGAVSGPIGAVVSGTVGYILGNCLYGSGHLAFGDTEAVKQSKIRREKAENIYSKMIPIMQESRTNLENYINEYFFEREELFNKAFKEIELSFVNHDNQAFLDALEIINNQYQSTIGSKSFKEMVLSDEAPW